MTDQLLDILKIAFLVLLYLFFARVLWVVASEVRAARQSNPNLAQGQITHLAEAPPVAAPVVVPVAPQPIPVARAPKGKRGTVGRLVVVEPRTRRGSSYAVGPEITIGRSPGCTVQIGDDAFVSSLHARVYVRDNYLLVEDIGSTNGTYLNGDRVQAPRPVGKGDRIQVGNTVLEAQ